MVAARHLSLVQNEPVNEELERKVADTDDGYTRIANELLEAVMSADLTARQLKVVLAIIRKTYGFGKKLDRITNTQIAAMTGIHHTHVCKAKNEMIAMRILVSTGIAVGVNKVVSDWNTGISQHSETLAKPANETLAKSANTHKPSQLNTKETIQKKKETTPKSPEGSLSVQEESNPEKPKRSRKKNSEIQLDHQRFINTWNAKAEKYGLPRITVISKTNLAGLTRLYTSHVAYCKQTGCEPADVDTMVNGYIEFGYTPTDYACGNNPSGTKYGLPTALTQRMIDSILTTEA
ncbi:hypothetical protein GCM10009414_20990 [Tatumella terrea]|uniref:replication protein n=1 Tax=Tatumella TaxID=82986 RepID=UPI001BB0AD0B|nr:replication protein [Tatumella sp. JGM118]MBS0909182.1 replication protein [Tatumella sp. JGM118]